MTAAAGTDRIASVQMLRFLAAFAVLVGHVEIFTYHLGRFRGVELWRPALVGKGAFGVDLFFAISGFVMIVSSQRLYGAQRARGAFVARRLMRIVPLYWLALAFTVAWGWRFGPAADAPTVASAFAFVPHASTIANGRIVPPLEVGWTLNYEMLFYALFAVCLASDAAATARRIGLVLGALVALGMATALPQPLAFWTDPVMIEFLGGIGIALLYRAGLRLAMPLRVAMLGLGALLVLAPFSGPQGALMQGGWSRALTWGAAGWLVLAATVLGPLRLPRADRWNLAGDLSYALYLVHMPLLMVAQFLWRHLAIPYGPAWATVFAASTIGASLIAAVIAHRLIERPILARASKRRDRL
ncbi:MAG: acyltransferase [Novosphingobium sp.]|nr:acyltransferase [Novosphingobium sp.]